MEKNDSSVEALKEENARLKASEAHYRLIYRNIPVMLHSINSEGKIIEDSNYWLETTGYQRNEVTGHASVDFLTEDSKQYAKNVALPDFFRKGYAYNVPYQLVKKNGEIMDVLLSAISEHDESGNFLRVKFKPLSGTSPNGNSPKRPFRKARKCSGLLSTILQMASEWLMKTEK